MSREGEAQVWRGRAVNKEFDDFVIAEQRDGTLNRASWRRRRRAAGWRADRRSRAGRQRGQSAAELATAEVDEVIALEHQALEACTPPTGYALALAALIAAEPPALVLPAAHLPDPRLRAGARRTARRAARHRCHRRRAEGGAAAFVRPVFQGKPTADVAPRGPAPHLATFQIGAYRGGCREARAPAPVRGGGSVDRRGAIRQKPEAPFKEAKQAVDLSQAERIVASAAASRARSTSSSRAARARRSAPRSPRRGRSATPAGCHGWQIGSSGRPSRRSSTSRSASRAPSSTSSA